MKEKIISLAKALKELGCTETISLISDEGFEKISNDISQLTHHGEFESTVQVQGKKIITVSTGGVSMNFTTSENFFNSHP